MSEVFKISPDLVNGLETVAMNEDGDLLTLVDNDMYKIEITPGIAHLLIEGKIKAVANIYDIYLLYFVWKKHLPDVPGEEILTYQLVRTLSEIKSLKDNVTVFDSRNKIVLRLVPDGAEVSEPDISVEYQYFNDPLLRHPTTSSVKLREAIDLL